MLQPVRAQDGSVTPPPTGCHFPLHALYAQNNLKSIFPPLNTKCVFPHAFPRWTGRATVAWSRNCLPFVRTRRMMKSSTPCHGHLAHLCVFQGGSTHPCAHPSFPQGPFVPRLITAAQPHFRYLWSVSAVPLQSSAPGARTSDSHILIFINFVRTPSNRCLIMNGTIAVTDRRLF